MPKLEELRAEGKIRSLGVSNYTARTRPGRLIALSVLHSESVSCRAFVWARRALNSPKRRFRPGQVEDYRELMEHATVPPTVNQIEVNLFIFIYFEV